MSSKIGKLSELENVLCHNESLYKGVLKSISAFKIGRYLGFYEAAKTRGWRVSVLIVSLLLFRLKGLNRLCKALHNLFKECKQYLSLGQCQNTDFDGQIADTTLVMITHVILTLNKRFEDYETMGALFRDIQQDLLELTLYERLIQILEKVVIALAEMFGIDSNEGMERMVKNENIPDQLIKVVMELSKTWDNCPENTNPDKVAA